MPINLDFLRFDRTSKTEGFVYKSTDNLKESEYDFNSVTMDKLGSNLFTNIQNYMPEAVLLGGNLRVNPTRIKSLRQTYDRTREDFRNYVVITILHSENGVYTADPKRRSTQTRKTEIRIPGKMLNQGSVFISELDCYLMMESKIDATRELIARDVEHHQWDSVNIPSSMIKQDPSVIYDEYKQLAKFCIQRQDKINIRIGIDLQYGNIPDIVKGFHVGILDSYFVPYKNYKLIYDPTLSEDEFVIENLHLASRDEFRSTFTELKQYGAMYLDHDEQNTLFGKFYGMALFSSSQEYLNYVHKRKSQERFSDETLYVANRSGDPRLKEEIVRLERDVLTLREKTVEKEEENVALKESNKKLKADVKDREETINKIRNHHDSKMSSEAILTDLSNESQRLNNDSRKIDNDRIDMDHREKAAPLLHKASVLKITADILKSGWGIATVCLTGMLSIAAVCKKYNVKLSVGT